MIEVTIAGAKTQLSKLVKLANQGEEVVITSGRARKPVARIVAIEPKEPQTRPLGLYEGMFTVGPEFSSLCLKRNFASGMARAIERRAMRHSFLNSFDEHLHLS